MEALFKAWNLYFNKLILWFWCLLEFQDYCRVVVFSPVIPQIDGALIYSGSQVSGKAGQEECHYRSCPPYLWFYFPQFHFMQF